MSDEGVAGRGSPLAEPRAPRRRTQVAAFQSRDFRLLWVGLLVGNMGTWMQFTTLGYLVASLAGGAARASLFIGILGASRAIPVLLCSPFAGVVADRYPRRRILMLTNASTSILSLTLATLTVLHRITIVEVFLISGGLAAVSSFDAPARQSWIPYLVPREHVASAVGLNQIAFNTPAIVGPPIAGLLIVWIGVAASFFVNAATILAVVVAVFLMRSNPERTESGEPVLQAIWAGIRFIAEHPVLRWIVLILFVNALVLRPYNFLLPAYALHVVDTDARGLGVLMAATGTGAVLGAFITALVSTGHRARRWFVGTLAFGASVLALGLTHSYWIAFGLLFFVGIGNISFTGSSNIILQILTPDGMRGRAMSVHSMILQGGVPAGTLLLGSIAAATNLSVTLAGAGALALLSLLVVWLTHPAVRNA